MFFLIRFHYICVVEAKDGDVKKLLDEPDEYKTNDLLERTYQTYVKERKNRTKVFKPYIAANLSEATLKKDRIFEIGTTKVIEAARKRRDLPTKTKYVNGELFPNTNYYVFVRSHTTEVNINCCNFLLLLSSFYKRLR